MQHYFQKLQQSKYKAIQSYFIHRNPQTFFRLYTQALDDTLMNIWAELFSGSQLCLVATGGYGREEIYPYSDLDLAIIAPQSLTQQEQETISLFVQTLWDNQLTPAIKSGSLVELLQAAKEDLAAETAFLEMRFISGNQTLAQQSMTAFQRQLNKVVFIENKLLEMQQRHAQQPAFMLEPNVKNGAGGLRDIHTMIWLAKTQGLPADFYALMRQKIITRVEAGLLRNSHRRLACLRIDLHLAAEREEDRLIFDLQGILAEKLGFSQQSKQAGCEQLMKIYYQTAKTVMQLNGILIPMLRSRLYSPIPRITQDIDEDYYQVGNLIAVKDLNLFHQHPHHLFKIVSLFQQHRNLQGIAPKTLRQWWSASRLINQDFYQNATHRAYFLSFFQTGEGLTHVMRLLNLYGLLARYLPNWHKIVGLLQHDLFHIYPVDDHILTVLRNMRRLAMEQHSHELPFASNLMQHFPRPYVLYLAALFHDIAKGRQGDHAKLGVFDTQRFADDHRLPEEDKTLLCWLVEQHLLMSLTAQKEDIQDPIVIERFCQQVQNQERLTALYLLTIADIRGTNPKIWTTWKAQLLENLYHSATRYLAGDNASPESMLVSRRQQAQYILTQQNKPPKMINKILQTLGDAYFVRHETDMITWHLSQLSGSLEQPIVAVRAINHDTIQAMVYMPNTERLFTRLCRIMGQYQFSIVAARAFITTHDYILDTFTLIIPSYCDQTELENLQHQLKYTLQQFAEQPNEPSKSTHKPSRRARLLPIIPHVEIYADEHHQHGYIIKITSADRPYLLADITEIFAQHRISLNYAKIQTLGERAEDSFIVTIHDWNASKEYALTQDLLDILRV